MSLVNVKRLEFVRGPERDRMDTGRVVLDANATPYRIVMLWRPCLTALAAAPTRGVWAFDMWTTSGADIVRGAAVRDRTDVLLGVSTTGRPRGAIVSYDPKGRGDPTLTSYSDDDVRLYYLPDGFVPADFALYTSSVT